VDYVETIRAVAADVVANRGDEPVEAAWHLALLGWRHLGGHDEAWDRFGLNVLAACEMLAVHPVPTVACDPPARDGLPVRGAVVALVTALAARLEHDALDTGRSFVDRLVHDGAARELRRAVWALL
jgi:hypothetical protein